MSNIFTTYNQIFQKRIIEALIFYLQNYKDYFLKKQTMIPRAGNDIKNDTTVLLGAQSFGKVGKT